MGMIDDIKKTYEVYLITPVYSKKIIFWLWRCTNHLIQLTETELNDLEKGVHGMEMRRQKSFHTINKMNIKVCLISPVSLTLNIHNTFGDLYRSPET